MSHDTCMDDAHMRRIQNGDESAFVILVQKYQQFLHGYFFKHLGDYQMAEDLTQESLIRLRQKCHLYNPNGRFSSWLFSIAKHSMIDVLRRKTIDSSPSTVSITNSVTMDLADGISSQPDERAICHELNDLFDAALDTVPHDQRTVFILHHFFDMTLHEISEATESCLPTAKSRLRLAREKICRRLTTLGVLGIDGIPQHVSDNS